MFEDAGTETILDVANDLYCEIRRRQMLTIQIISNVPWDVGCPNDVVRYETILNAVDNSTFLPGWDDRESRLEGDLHDAEFFDEVDYAQICQKVRAAIRCVRLYQSRIEELRSELDHKKKTVFKWAFRFGLIEGEQEIQITDELWTRILLDIGKPYFRDAKPDGRHTIAQCVKYANERSHTFQHQEEDVIVANFGVTHTPLTDVICLGKVRPSRDFVVQEVPSQRVATIWGLPRGWHMSNFVEVAFPFTDTTRSLTHVLDDSDSLELEFRLLLESTDAMPETVWKSSVDSLWIPLPTQRTITEGGKGQVMVCLKTTTKALSAFGFGADGNSGGAFGDPYINPLWGHVYKLPVDDRCYRFLDVGTGPDRLVVNIKCWVVPSEVQRETTAWGFKTLGGARSRKFLKNNQGLIARFAESVGSQSFIREVAVFLGGECLLIHNLEEHLTHVSKLEMSRCFMSYGTGTRGVLPVYQRDPAACIVASLATRTLGTVRILLNRFYNPQLRTGVTIIPDRAIPRDACGLMCRHYIPETVRTRDLLDAQHIHPVPNKSNCSVTDVFIENGSVFNVNFRV